MTYPLVSPAGERGADRKVLGVICGAGPQTAQSRADIT